MNPSDGRIPGDDPGSLPADAESELRGPDGITETNAVYKTWVVCVRHRYFRWLPWPRCHYHEERLCTWGECVASLDEIGQAIARAGLAPEIYILNPPEH